MDTTRADLAPLDPYRLVPVADAARLRGVHPRAARAAIRRGELPAYTTATRWRVRLADVDRWIASRRFRGAPDQNLLPRVRALILDALAARGALVGEIRRDDRPLSAALELLDAAIAEDER